MKTIIKRERYERRDKERNGEMNRVLRDHKTEREIADRMRDAEIRKRNI